MAYGDKYKQRMKELGWDDLIQSAAGSGNDALREQYIRYRNSGVSKMDVQTRGGVDLGGGYTYDSIHGGTSFKDPDKQGYSYKYDPITKTTEYGGRKFKGKYDPNILRSITEDDYLAAETTVKPDYESRLGTFENASDDQFNQFYAAYGRNAMGGPEFDYSKISGKYQELYDQYQDNTLKTAYEAASSRYEGDNVLRGVESGDYTDYYKSQLPSKTAGYDMDAIMSNPNMSEAVKQHYLSQARGHGQDVSSYDTSPEESLPQVQSTNPELEAYSEARDKMMISGGSQADLGELRDQYLGEAPSTASYAEAMEAPTIESTGGKVEAPWSTDFEKQFISQLSGISSNLSNYLGSANISSPSTNFNLGYQQSTAMNTSTPTLAGQQTKTGIQPGQPSTGKGGSGKTLWS